MPEPEFHVEVTNQSVYVRLDVSTRAGKTRFYALAFFAVVTVLLMCALLFLPGKHGSPSLWQGLSTAPLSSADVLLLFVLSLSFPLLVGILLERYVTLAYPSDETFRCDGSTLSISRVRWLDVHNNHWNTLSYSLAEVREIRYRAITGLRGYSIYGLRFVARGKTQRILPGLNPRDAENVLIAIKAFGADVPDDPVVSRKLKETISQE